MVNQMCTACGKMQIARHIFPYGGFVCSLDHWQCQSCNSRLNGRCSTCQRDTTFEDLFDLRPAVKRLTKKQKEKLLQYNIPRAKTFLKRGPFSAVNREKRGPFTFTYIPEPDWMNMPESLKGKEFSEFFKILGDRPLPSALVSPYRRKLYNDNNKPKNVRFAEPIIVPPKKKMPHILTSRLLNELSKIVENVFGSAHWFNNDKVKPPPANGSPSASQNLTTETLTKAVEKIYIANVMVASRCGENFEESSSGHGSEDHCDDDLDGRVPQNVLMYSILKIDSATIEISSGLYMEPIRFLEDDYCTIEFDISDPLRRVGPLRTIYAVKDNSLRAVMLVNSHFVSKLELGNLIDLDEALDEIEDYYFVVWLASLTGENNSRVQAELTVHVDEEERVFPPFEMINCKKAETFGDATTAGIYWSGLYMQFIKMSEVQILTGQDKNYIKFKLTYRSN